MLFVGGVAVVLCVLSSTECSIFDSVEVVDDYDENVRIRIGNFSAAMEIIFNTKDVVTHSGSFRDCSSTNKLCRNYDNETYLVVNKGRDECLTLNYTSENTAAQLKATFDIRGIHLYGGAEHAEAKWPVDKIDLKQNSHVTKTQFYQAIVEPYWLMSNGHYVYVAEGVPLFVTQNYGARIFRLIAANESPYAARGAVALNFTVCRLANARAAQEDAIRHFLGKPTAVPDVRRVRQPLWSTWAKYKADIDEERVLSYAERISGHGYGGQLQIDDDWERCYGSLLPNATKFGDFGALVARLKRLGFTVAVWIHPFVNVDCGRWYREATERGLVVKNEAGDWRTRWWNGETTYVDFTNPLAGDWFRRRLENLRRVYGVDAFKFDGGESDFSPKPGAVYREMGADYPETIVKAYVRMISGLGPNVHTRVARATQRYPVFVTMMDRDSHWTSNLGLKSVIPQLLQMNVLGYSFALPDMIGGNFYRESATAELFVRWLQLNVFMPSLQFSVPPWDYNEEVVDLSKKFVDLHVKYSDKIIELMWENVKTGAPVNPPIWWIAPNDPVALTCDSEFLLGEDILVAPVLVQGATSRDIYLPEGYWKDENADEEVIFKGPVWVRNYEAGLHVLPYFLRISSDKIAITRTALPLSCSKLLPMFVVISIILFIFLVWHRGRKSIRRIICGIRLRKK